MKFSQLLIRAGWYLFVISFVFPVHRDGVTLADGRLPGWEAMSLALEGNAGAWGVVSALTNILMIVTLVVLIRPKWTVVLGLEVLIAGATLLNAYWFIAAGDARGELRLGYYFWWASFAFVTAGLWLRARSSTPAKQRE